MGPLQHGMRNLTEINLNEGGKPVNRTKPDTKDLESLSNMIGSSLPTAYTEFLMFSNGGCPELDTFEVSILGIKQNWAVNRFFHLTADEKSVTGIIYNYFRYSRIIGEGFLPIADDGGGNFICLDLTIRPNTKVMLWIHDSPISEPVFISDSFEEFINMLHVNPDYI